MTEHDLTNEAHRETCAECTTTWTELEAISAQARALPTLTPSRDLWTGIAARIGWRYLFPINIGVAAKCNWYYKVRIKNIGSINCRSQRH